jgi:hypothetical protein
MHLPTSMDTSKVPRAKFHSILGTMEKHNTDTTALIKHALGMAGPLQA